MRGRSVASLLVWAMESIHPDPSMQWMRHDVGDVVDIADDDDFNWGLCVTDPDHDAAGMFKVVVLLGVAMADILSLATGDSAFDVSDAPRRLRINKIDLDGLHATVAPKVQSRGAIAVVDADPAIVTDLDTLMSFTTLKPPLK